MSRVSILMGSESDLDTVKEAVAVLRQFNEGFEIKVLSAHRTPKELVRYVEGAPKRGVGLYCRGRNVRCFGWRDRGAHHLTRHRHTY
jgi:5-(carboxyamino)imidazole ribonucleotide mutase